jgi:hypothetical protein
MRRAELGVRLSDLASLGALAGSIRSEMVEDVLRATGRESQRIRELPAPMMVYFVVALALFRTEEMREVLRLLQEGGRQVLGWDPCLRQPATRAAITRARQRLGEEPLRELFARVARPLATRETPGAYYRQWRVMALDGTTLEMPDSEANAAAFGRPRNTKGEGARPLLRLMGLVEVGTHAFTAAEIGPYTVGETTLCRPLLAHVEPEMLCLADRLFPGYALWKEALSTGAALVWRVQENFHLPPEALLEDGSYLSRLYAGWDHGRPRGEGLGVRVIEYEIRGRAGERYRLITNLLDPTAAPAEELAALYCERWEFETALDEFKTHLRGPRTVLRSQRPELVRQEVWGLLLAHYALRRLMHDAAERCGRDPDRISFVHTLRVVRRSLPQFAAFSPSAAEGVL